MTDNERIAELESRVAGLMAALEIGLVRESVSADKWLSARFRRFLKDTAPILAAHDAAKQAELVEALRRAAVSENVCECDGTKGECLSCYLRATLAKYPKAAKEGASVKNECRTPGCVIHKKP